jgi:hypothetical protein
LSFENNGMFKSTIDSCKFVLQFALECDLGETPRRGGRQQPHHLLKKFKKNKGGKKRHTMVAQSSPKMPK